MLFVRKFEIKSEIEKIIAEEIANFSASITLGTNINEDKISGIIDGLALAQHLINTKVFKIEGSQ